MGIDAQMLVRTTAKVTPDAVRRWAAQLADCFGCDAFGIYGPGQFSWQPDGRHALEIVSTYEQDGDPIEPEPGETLIEVHLSTRYYGIGYERGNLPQIIAVAQWLEDVIPEARVFYGGDSSGVCASPFDAAARRALWLHFIQHGHAPYHSAFGDVRGGSQSCAFCLGKPMGQFMWAGDTVGWACTGCGLHREVTRGRIEEAYREWPRDKKQREAAARKSGRTVERG